MTTNPTKLVDSEGEEMSLNRVDKALRSVGITLQDANGQFRDFDEVILELSSKWDTIDKNTQRYIATIMAGNRQQSRFLALVGNYDRLSELYEEAADSQDAATLQQLKTLDSIETKLNKVKVSLQNFYTDSGIENIIKGLLDAFSGIIERFGSLPTIFGGIPVVAFTIIGKVIALIKTLGTNIVSTMQNSLKEGEHIGAESGTQAGSNWASNVIQGIRAKMAEIKAVQQKALGDTQQREQGTPQEKPNIKGYAKALKENIKGYWNEKFVNQLPGGPEVWNKVANIAKVAGPLLSAAALAIPKNAGHSADWMVGRDVGQMASGAISGLEGALRLLVNPTDAMGWISFATGLANLFDGLFVNTEEKLKALEERSKNLKEEALIKKDEYDTLQKAVDNIDRLKESQYDSEEATQEYIDAMNDLAEKNPELITGFDNMGNAIIDTVNAEEALEEARKESATAAYEAAIAEAKAAQFKLEKSKKITFEQAQIFREDIILDEISRVNQASKDKSNLYYDSGTTAEQNYNSIFQRNDYSEDQKKALKTLFSYDENGNVDGWDLKSVTYKDFQAMGINSTTGLYNNIMYQAYEEGLLDPDKELEVLRQIQDYMEKVEKHTVTGDDTDELEAVLSTFIQKNPFSALTPLLQEVVSNWESNVENLAIVVKNSDALNATNLNSIAQKLLLYGGTESFTKESTGLFTILQSAIKKDYDNSDAADIDAYLSEQTSWIITQIETYSDFWELLSTSEQEAINKVFEDRAKYTYDEYKSILNDLYVPQDIIESAMSDYTTSAEKAVNRFVKKIELDDNLNSLSEDITKLQETLAYGLLDDVAEQFTEAGKRSEKEAQELLNLYNSLEKLGPEAERIASEADLSSLTGIHEMTLAMKEIGIDTSEIELSGLQESLIVNLETEYNTLVTTMSERIKNMTDQLKSALEGMDLEEAMNFSEKWKINLSDLDFKDGKFFLEIEKNADLIEDYYMGQYESLLEQLNDETQTMQTALKDNQVLKSDKKIVSEEYLAEIQRKRDKLLLKKSERSFENPWTAEDEGFLNSLETEIGQITTLPQELYSVYESNISEWEEMSDDERKGYGNDLASFLSAQLGIQRDDAQAAIEEYGNYMFNSALIAGGRINEAVKNILGEESNLSPDDIIKSFRKGDFKELLGVDELDPYFEELYDKLANSLPEAWSDIVENLDGKKLIKVDDTNRDIYQDLDTQGIVEQISGDYYRVVAESQEKVVAAILKSGMGLEDINAQLLAVEEYYNSKATSKETQLSTLLDIIGDPTKVEISILETLANSLGITIEELKKYFSENLDGTYSTGIAQINYLINEFGLESSTEINDALREYLDNILGLISNGLSGSMTGLEAEELNNFIQQYNSDFNIQTIETAEGFKLTENSAFEIYNTLKNINALAAKTMLSEMAENAMDADESLNDVHKVTKQILETEKQIIALEGNQDGVKRLSAQLDLAKEIRQQLMMEGDAFNFMDQDRTTGESNPLSAWEGLGQALEVLDGDDFKAGYIDYTDLDNMISMMEQYGVNLSDVATSFNGEAVTAANLMEAAAKALTTVDGEVFVDLSKFGQSFKLNADGMKEGISDGIKEMARSQIEMLDAEIAFLETIVKQEEIFKNLDTDNNENLSLSEMANVFFGDPENLVHLKDDPVVKEILEEYGNSLVEYNGRMVSILSLYDELSRTTDKFERENILLAIAQAIENSYASLDKDWSVQGGLLFKNGIQVELPEITFNPNSDSEALNEALAGQSEEVKNKIKNFIETSDLETITLSDIISFAIEEQLGDSVISALYGLVDGATKEINGETFVWDINLQTYVSSDGTQYELPNGEVVNSKEEFLQAQTTGGTADYLMTQGIITKLNGQGFTFDGVTYYKTLEEAYDAYYSQKLADSTPVSEQEQKEVETDVALTIKSNNISIGQENENGIVVIDINGVEANAKSVIVSVNEDNVEFKDSNGNVLTGPEVLAQLNILEAPDADKFTLLQEAIANLEISEEVFNSLNNFLTAIQEIADAANSIEITGPARVNALAYGIKSIPTEKKTVPIELSVSTNGSIDVSTVGGTTGAKGSIANLSFATGNAKATGTLMGELGPELYVTGGRYYVAGQNGAEFVNLPSDAIVFNHLQTKKLLNNGSINGTGKAITNEKKATAMASGNINGGPAKASASDALAELKEIRALWQGLLDIDAKSLGKKAGGGGGGGGSNDNKAFLHDLERWYNLLRQIEKLEQQITYEQAKRANMQSGYSYSDSLEKELELLKKQQKANQQLSALQKDYYDKRRQELLSTDYSKVFTYDEDGLMQYVDGKGRGLDILATLNDTDANGKALMNSSQQLEYLKSVGFDTKVLETNADGTEAESEEQMLQNFWDGVDGWMDELDGLYDSYNDAEIAVQEAIEAQTAILQEYIDNQLSVEGKLLQAIVDREQAEIDRLQDEKDALEEASQAFIDGLSDSLNKEKELYDRNEDASETSKLQRQLAILQRSGGSATEIKSLQDQIDSRLQDSYFQAQQDQIDAIEKASNNQLEKLQDQIDLMTETLEYQKANGLLWEEVSTMINSWTPEQMLQFIEEYTSSYKEKSALDNEETSKETLKELEMLVDERDGEAKDKAWTDYYNGLKDYSEEVKKEHAVGAKAAFDEAYATGGYSAAKAAADAYYKKAIGPSSGSNNNSKDNNERDQSEYPYGKASETTGNIKEGAKGNSVKAIQYALNKLGFGNAGTESVDGIFGSGTTKAVKAFQKANGIAVDGIVGNETRAKFKAKKYKTGGLVDYTGPAWVDGSKSKPEAFLSASDTAMLKSKIFSNSDGSLKTLVAALEEITKNTSRYSTDNSVSEQIIIQSAQVNIQPGVISNDYDARKAGEKALEEMVKIARKTTNRIVSR